MMCEIYINIYIPPLSLNLQRPLHGASRHAIPLVIETRMRNKYVGIESTTL